jgi:hypothetical protein
MKGYLVGFKVAFGLLGFSAIVTEIATLSTRGIFDLTNFSSYFTVQSNLLAIISFLASAFVLYAGKKSARLDFFRGAVTLYMVVTGIVFAVLLAGIEGVQLTAVPWDNTVLHYLIPLAVVADWLIDRPTRRIPLRRALWWLVFPIAYVVYSLIRGAVVGWYPYPFLNPINGGHGMVALTCLGIAVGGVVMVAIISRVAAKK